MQFDLYLESGPQHRKTWVFIPGLPGCTVRGPTTEAALEAVPAAIRERLDFLRLHGENAPVPESIELVIADHVIERKWLGFERQFFASDREPLSEEDVRAQLRWAGWSREDLVAAARAQAGPLAVKPATGGRSAAGILAHVAGAEWVTSALRWVCCRATVRPSGPSSGPKRSRGRRSPPSVRPCWLA
jgi:predicted RNase H-like HicB family nuclease